MRFSVRLICAIICIIIVLLSSGCGTKEERYAQKFIDYSQRLREAGYDFGKKVGKNISGKDMSSVREAHQHAVEVYDDIKADLEELEVPDLPHAQELYDEFQRFLRKQGRFIKVDCKTIMRIIGSKASRSSKQNRLVSLLRRLQRQEKRDLESVKRVFEKYAKANNVNIKLKLME